MVVFPQKIRAKFASVQRYLITAVLAVMVIVNVVPSFQAFINVPQAKADSWSLHSMFEDCTDDAGEQEWGAIKACLEGAALSDDATHVLWLNVIKPKLEAFYDSHGLNIPSDLSAQSYVYGSTPPSAQTMDAIITSYLSEEFRDSRSRKGADALQQIGTMLDSAIDLDESDVLCNGVLGVPLGSSSRNSNDLPSPYDQYVAYGPDFRGDMPTCRLADILSDSEMPYRIAGFAVANLYTVADIISDEHFNPLSEEDRTSRPDKVTSLNHLKATMTALKQHLTTPPPRAIAADKAMRDDSPAVDLSSFLAAQYTHDAGHDGPIENMMDFCQSDTAVRAANRNDASPDYLTALTACYRAHLPALLQAREFVTDVLAPATESLAREYNSWTTAQDKSLLRQFMQSDDYAQLGEAYDRLATERYDYRLEDYLAQTINDSYTDSSNWVYDTNLVDLSVTGVPLRYRAAFDNAVKWPILKHLKAVNTELIAKASRYLDRPTTQTSTPPTTPSAPATSGNTGTDNRATFGRELASIPRVQSVSRANVLTQLNNYITTTINARPAKATLLFAWYYLAVKDHQPNYPDATHHVSGDLSLLVEDSPGTGRWDSTFSDPFLAKLTNACSPNKFLDDITKEDLPAWKTCLQYEQNFVDHSDSNRAHEIYDLGPGGVGTDHFTMTLSPDATVFSLQRSEPVRTAIQHLIERIDACYARANCLSMNDRDEGGNLNTDASLPDNHQDTGNALMNTLLSWINVLLSVIIKFFFWLCTLVMSLFQAALNYTGFTTSDFVVTMWKAIRDFVNLFFILALLGIAIANIVQYEINNYAIKTILPKLIIIVIAVNFSRLFVGVVVDAANVVEAGVYQIGGMGPHGAGGAEICSQYRNPAQQRASSWTNIKIPDDVKRGSLLCRLAQGLKFEEMQNFVHVNNPNQPGNQIDFFLSNVALLLIVVMIFFGFLALAMTFSIRIIVLWALAITSPLYVVSKLSPLTQSIGGQWQGKFFKYATMHVGVAFFMTLAVLAADSLIPQIFSGVLQTPASIAGSQLGPSGFHSLADYLKLVFIVAMIYAGVFTAAKGDYAQGFIDKVAGWGSPSNVWGVTKKGLGLGYGASQAIGNRLRDVKTNRWNPLGYVIRGAGRVMSLPSNVVGGGKAIYTDLKNEAEKRKTRYGLQAANAMAYGVPFGGEMRDRFRGQVLANENKIVSEQKEDMKLRFTVSQIERRAADALSKGDSLRYKAALMALAEKGGLRWKDASAKEALRTAEARRTTQEQADNFMDQLEQTNISARDRRYQEAQGIVGRSGDKTEIDRRLLKAVDDGDQALAIGILTYANQTGRIKDSTGLLKNSRGDPLDGHGLALARLLDLTNRVDSNGNKVLIIDDDTRRMMTKAIGKESIAAYGTQFRSTGDEERFSNDLAALAIERDQAAAVAHGGISEFAKFVGKSFKDIAASASPGEIQRLTALMGQLGGAGQDASGRLLTQDIGTSTRGKDLAERIATIQRQNWGVNLVPEGEDATANTMVQFLEAPSVAETFRMADNGQFLLGTSKIKMMQGFMTGLLRNADADPVNAKQLSDVIANIKPTLVNAAQKQTMKTLLDDIEKSDPAFKTSPTLATRLADARRDLT